MVSKLVLFTGATGHVGYRTLIEALSRGYNVRAAVRSEAKFQTIANSPSTKPYRSQLTSVHVPDITATGAFDAAVQGVDYIVHIASPLSVPNVTDFEADYIQPAIRGTLSILESALNSPSVQRVVITSSVAAISSQNGSVYTADNVEPDPTGPYANFFSAYTASKRLAYNATRKFIEEKKPKFEIVNIMPSFVIGPNELATTPEAVNSGSNRLALISPMGGQNPAGTPMFVAHVDDVAFVHVEALESKYQGNKNWGVNWNGVEKSPDAKSWDSANEIIQRNFPEAVKSGLSPLGGSHKSHYSLFDASETEKAMGRQFKSFEDMVVDLVKHYVKVSGKGSVGRAEL